ncbi:hypothetical protein [Micromonospora echinofusca]|uniref:Winged helix DNA-binding domain-containing protein n=1 Tax=Micromonospora echinofusca TaxID=47858 RepID=A0ABS3VUZ4_MICEH|nr:hypothetical protein [Micromonospora echinofusca]MBO4208355.1 hypothetical protein [Micromonospora echinofusca]
MRSAPAGTAGSAPVPVGATGHGLTGVADAGAFLARLTRLDPAAVVRLRSTGAGRTALWARLPWDTLAVRTVAGTGPGDATVSAAGLLAELERSGGVLPERRDLQWRSPLPPPAVRTVESIPVPEVHRLAAAAAGTLRAAATHGVGGRAVGQRMLRDALLDHVAVVVTVDGPDPERVEIPQRLVQAVARMGFLGPSTAPGRPAGARPVDDAGLVRVCRSGRWTGLYAPYGAVWWLNAKQLVVRPAGDPPKV